MKLCACDGKIDDSKPNRGLKPLPNLEFKFVCANSLIGLPESESDAEYCPVVEIVELTIPVVEDET